MIAHRGLNNKYTNGGESLMRAGVIVYHGVIDRLTTLLDTDILPLTHGRQGKQAQ